MNEQELAGLMGEVVAADTYHLRTLPFVPDLIFDIGANIGLFTEYAHKLFPQSTIVAVEPHPDTVRQLRERTVTIPGLVILHAGLGIFPLYRFKGARNESGESYISPSPGYPARELRVATDSCDETAVYPILLDELFAEFWRPGLRTVVKMDCEGGENVIFDHEPSIKALFQADYIAAEIHSYGFSRAQVDEVRKLIESVVARLQRTHDCQREHMMLYALKRQENP